MMVLMFSASTSLGAPQNSSRILGPLLRWLLPDLHEEKIREIQFFIRKGCHVAEYAVLCLLIWRARRNTVANPKAESRNPNFRRTWRWADARFAILVSAIYAATDEFHQSFVATRQGSLWDVLLDTSGATAGIVVLWQIGRWMKRW